MIGITVWAKKPDNPGKPSSPEPDIADYQIWIGNGPLGSPEDVVLQPYGDPPTQDHLVVEDVGYSEGWLPPPTKGKKHIEGWSILLEKTEGDYCGTYDIFNNNGLIKTVTDNDFWPIKDQDVYRISIIHSLISPETPEDNPARPRANADYWSIRIQFENGTFFEVPGSEPPFMVPYFLVLEGNTDTGLEPEGEYDENKDTWTVSFNEALFRVITWSSESWDEIELWTGQLSFTVEIKRTLNDS
jgi:hypothetical protein